MLRCCTFSCTSTHTSCYPAAHSFALPHIRHAMLLHALLHFHTYVLLPAARSFALPHIRHATLLHFLLPFHTYLMLCCSTFSCASTHTSRYEPEQLALLMVAKLGRSLQTTNARNTLQMAKRCPQPKWVCEALGQKAHKKEFFSGWNTDFRQTVGPKGGSTCMLQSGAGASKAMSWITSDNFVLERKNGTFRRNPRRTKLLFRACKTLDFPLSSDLSKGFAPEIYSINVNMYKLLQFRTLPSSSWHCVMSSPTRPLTDAVTLFLFLSVSGIKD